MIVKRTERNKTLLKKGVVITLSFILMHKILQVAGIIHPLMCLK